MDVEKKLIVTTTGFYNTGSSAITHMLSEFDGVDNKSGVYEMRFIYDPDCISDLEYNLIENPHRYNTSYSIVRFKKYIDFNSNKFTNHHYEKLCEGNFRKISYDYINDISDFSYLGASHIDVYQKGKLFWIINRLYRKIVNSIWNYIPPRYIPGTLMKPQTQYAGTPDVNIFLNATRKYVSRILSYMNKTNSNVILLDQIFPPTNIKRYLRYIPDEYNVKTFIVDRDPRDLFVLCKYVENTQVIPCQTPEIFCNWFLWTRMQSHRQEKSNNYMRVQFEDLIYKYDETREAIVNYCGFNDMPCSKKKQIFKPLLSINNTQVWKRFPECSKEIEYISEKLKKFCYDYSSSQLAPDFVHGKVFEC